MMELLILFFAAMVGQLAHWAKRAVRKQTFASYVEYMKHDHYASFRAVGSIAVAVIGLVAGGLTEISLQNVCITVMAGYNIDSVLNTFPED